MSSGEYGGSRIRLTLEGTTTPGLVWWPAPSQISTPRTPLGSSAENRLRETLIDPTLSVGEVNPQVWPVVGPTAASRDREPNRACLTPRGREPSLLGPHPTQRPPPAGPPLVPGVGTHVLVGMPLLDGLEVVVDDLLERLLDPLVGVLVLRAGHEVGQAQAVQQVIHPLETQLDLGLFLEDALMIDAVEGGSPFIGPGAGLDSPPEAFQLGSGQARRSSGVPLLGQRVGAMLVVLSHPAPDEADRAGEGRGDVGGGPPLEGEDDDPVTLPGAFVGDGVGSLVEFVEG